MTPRRTFILLMLSLVVTLGCQQKKRRDSLRVGRGTRAGFNAIYNKDSSYNNRQANQCGTVSGPAGKGWGGVTSGNQVGFWNELYYLSYPSLKDLGAEDQLGYVSAQANQSTGVRFWGNAQTNGSNYLDQNSAEIRVEIFDDRTCQQTADGQARPPVAIHIGSQEPGFVGAGGTLGNGQANIYFEDIYGRIVLTGTYNAQNFTGTMSYTINGFTTQPRQLGQFTVPTCAFFSCY